MRDSPIRSTRAAIIAAALLTFTSMTAPAAPSPLADARSEVTPDGLHRVSSTVLPLAWMKPGVDFKRYTKILFVPDGMTFKGRISDSSGEFPISFERQQMLSKMILEVFTEELGKLRRYTLVDRAGKDVLVVRGAMLDIVSHVAPTPATGDDEKVETSIGEATLVVELQDSMTGEFLSRGLDRRYAPAASQRASHEDNAAQLRKAVHQWASELRQRLEEL
jgi:hypothetical protein